MLDIEFSYNPVKHNVSIIGADQTGKTTLGVGFVKMLYPRYNVIVYTPHADSKFHKAFPQFVVHNIFDLKPEGLTILQPMINSHYFFDQTCKEIWKMHDVVFIADELHNDIRKYVMPPNFEILVRNCGNRNIGYVAIFQRPADIHSDVLSNSRHRFCYFMDLPTDIDYMSKWIGEEMRKFPTGEIAEYHGLYKKRGSVEGAKEFYYDPSI